MKQIVLENCVSLRHYLRHPKILKWWRSINYSTATVNYSRVPFVGLKWLLCFHSCNALLPKHFSLIKWISDHYYFLSIVTQCKLRKQQKNLWTSYSTSFAWEVNSSEFKWIAWEVNSREVPLDTQCDGR